MVPFDAVEPSVALEAEVRAASDGVEDVVLDLAVVEAELLVAFGSDADAALAVAWRADKEGAIHLVSSRLSLVARSLRSDALDSETKPSPLGHVEAYLADNADHRP